MICTIPPEWLWSRGDSTGKHFALRAGLIASSLVLAWVLTTAFALCSRCATYFPPDVWLAPTQVGSASCGRVHGH
jgi:hypothetical protein